jgi:AraC-like DNA-binding protein
VALIAEVLDALRFHGWFFCVSELTAPWSLQLPGGRLAAIHAVLEGECVVTLAGGASPVKLGPGDVVVLPRDDVHSISDRAGRKPVPVTAIPGIDRRDRNATTFSHGGGGARTVLMTASFAADIRIAHAIVAGLPGVIVLRAGTAACARIAPVLTLVRAEAAQAGGASVAVLRRSAEILFVQSLREALLEATPATGWLAAASDPRLASVMAAIHAAPERRWTIAQLARLAHLSRTSFFERFCASLGQTPADYLQWWRLQLAAQRLRETQDSVGIIAASVGYDNASAFARAFRRAMGQSPQSFRAARVPGGREAS